jgi:hypothetical protein
MRRRVLLAVTAATGIDGKHVPSPSALIGFGWLPTLTALGACSCGVHL